MSGRSLLGTLLILTGSVGYTPPQIVSLSLYSGENIHFTPLWELSGDSIRIGNNRWFNLQLVRRLTPHYADTPLEVLTTNDSVFVVHNWTVTSGGHLSGEAYWKEDDDGFESRVFRHEEIQYLQNVSTMTPTGITLLGALTGAAIGATMAPEHKTSSGSGMFSGMFDGCKTAGNRIAGAGLGCAGGSLIGFAIGSAAAGDFIEDFSGLTLDQRRLRVQDLLER